MNLHHTSWGMTGTIKNLNEKGFGFIRVDGTEGAKDLFFHFKDLIQIDFDSLYVGQRVAFQTERSDRGPKATKVCDVEFEEHGPPESDQLLAAIAGMSDASRIEFFRGSLDKLHYLSPFDFEELIAHLLDGLGFQVELVSRAQGGRRDIFATSHDVFAARYLVECERRIQGQLIDVEALQALRARALSGLATKAVLVTTARFAIESQDYLNDKIWQIEGRDYNGLSEWFEVYRQRSRPSAEVRPFYSVYISHGDSDEEFARRLYEELALAGVKVFFPPEHARVGRTIHRATRDGIEEFDRIIFVCSRAYLGQKKSLNELLYTFEREHRDGVESYLMPVRLDAFVESWNPEDPAVARTLRARVCANFDGADRDSQKFNKCIPRLIAALRKPSAGG